MTAKSSPRGRQGRFEQVSPSIFCVGRGSWGKEDPLSCLGDGNLFLLRGSRSSVLIDLGGGKGTAQVEANVAAFGVPPQDIAEVWLTHLHCDHSGGVAAWQERRPLACRLSDVGCKMLGRGDLRLAGVPAIGPGYRPPTSPRPLRPGQKLRLPPWTLEVVPLPGHSADCIGFRGLVDGMDVLFAGDAIIGDQEGAKGVIGWLDILWMSNVRQYEHTLREAIANPPQLLLPGHGLALKGPAVKTSLRNCLRRLGWVRKIPQANTMFPFMG
jgi:glyoxylase-like metal-dependent hydrolase (beta-lactamase superfamily II)